jgi:CMP-N-acetylneuraminic acid synthetase
MANISVGIVGLPNVGKSTLFNALTKKSVPAENYPFCTIDPSVGIIPVPDERLDKLNEFSKSKKKILALIPARGGSKGMPGKNVVDVGGLPLIAHSIKSAKKSKLVDKIVVSTDSEEIAKIAKKYGAEVPFLRPKKIAGDRAPTIHAVLHALDWLENHGEKFDAVALLEPTSPLRKNDDVDNAIKLLLKNYNKTDAVVSVGEIYLEHPSVMKVIEKKYLKPFLPSDKKIHQRQQLSKVYFPYGVIYLCKTSTLRKQKTFYPKRIMPYRVERWQNYEVDDKFDLLCVEAILKNLKSK